MTDTTIGAEEIADIQVRIDYAKEHGRDDVAVDVEPLQALLDLVSCARLADYDAAYKATKAAGYACMPVDAAVKDMSERLAALPAAPAAGDEKPAFHLSWDVKNARYTVSEPNIGDVDCYTADQVARIREQARRDAIAECIKRASSYEHTEYPMPDNLDEASYRWGLSCGKDIAIEDISEALEALAEAKS